MAAGVAGLARQRLGRGSSDDVGIVAAKVRNGNAAGCPVDTTWPSVVRELFAIAFLGFELAPVRD